RADRRLPVLRPGAAGVGGQRGRHDFPGLPVRNGGRRRRPRGFGAHGHDPRAAGGPVPSAPAGRSCRTARRARPEDSLEDAASRSRGDPDAQGQVDPRSPPARELPIDPSILLMPGRSFKLMLLGLAVLYVTQALYFAYTLIPTHDAIQYLLVGAKVVRGELGIYDDRYTGNRVPLPFYILGATQAWGPSLLLPRLMN